MAMDEESALGHFRRALEAGSPKAHLNMGVHLQAAEGVDSPEAVEHLLRAAQQGHPHACYLTALAFRAGQGVPLSNKKSLDFLKTAAKLEHTEALYELGISYVRGDCVPVDLDEAEQYLDRAIQQGHTAAKYELALLLLPMTDKPSKMEKAMALFHEASSEGHPEAIYQLAQVLEADSEMVQAAREYALAAKLGSAAAMMRMGQLCEEQAERPRMGRVRDAEGEWIVMTMDTAFEWYKKAAEAEHVEAQAKLGAFYDPAALPTCEERDAGRAFECYRKGAEMQDCIAQYMVAVCYQEGRGVEQDFQKAADYFERAAAHENDPVPTAENGYTNLHRTLKRPPRRTSSNHDPHSNRGDRRRTATDSRSLLAISRTQSGKVEAEHKNQLMRQRQHLLYLLMDRVWYSLGVIYETGCGRPRSYAKAARFYRKAMNLNGHVRSTVALGLCYQDSRGLHQDTMEGVKLFKIAADTDTDGKFDADDDFGKPGHLSWAQRREDLAGRATGKALAQTVLGLCYMHGKGVYRDAAMAMRHFRQGCKGGNAEAACCIGDCYKEGFGVAFNMQQAVAHYKLAAERGNCRGQCEYAQCLQDGRGTNKDMSEAVKWYRAAADQNWAEAQYHLGRCCMDGISTTQDARLAFELFEKAAAQHLAQAEYALGRCYKHGLGTEQNIDRSKELLAAAAAHGFTPAAVRQAPSTVRQCAAGLWRRVTGRAPKDAPEPAGQPMRRSAKSAISLPVITPSPSFTIHNRFASSSTSTSTANAAPRT